VPANARIGWDDWAFGIVKAIARRGDCTRRQVGCIILNTEHRIAGAGFNGTRPGEDGCLDGACPRGRHYEEPKTGHWEYLCDDACHDPDCRGCGANETHYDENMEGPDCPDSECVSCKRVWPCAVAQGVCACGKTWPCPDAAEPGSSYDTGPGACIASHAESNAISDAQIRGAGRMPGAVMYVSTKPCEGCIRRVRNETDIKAIIWPEGAIGLP